VGKRTWPPWWAWELRFDSHLLKRMPERRFTEVDVRLMLEDAAGFRRDIEEGRWVVLTRHSGRAWEVIVEPDFDAQELWVITAYGIRERRDE